MGRILLAKCECGYKEEIFSGRGKASGNKYCAVPALCRNCKKVIKINYFDKGAKCEDCNEKPVSFDDLSVSNPLESTEKVLECRKKYVLREAEYLCPKCNQMTLKFEKIGYWD
ncbi:MAG: hypothetical protein ACTSR3_15905 [Candidatus Helarchaeota archaeon]